MSTPRVSVVIPTYNHAAFIGTALAGVLAQSFADWEALVINNHSTDDTVRIIDEFRDSRIRRIDFANQGVIGAARNIGIREARGEFVAFLDSDDQWLPDKLTRSLARMEQGAGLVCHAELWTGSGIERVVRYGPVTRAAYDPLLFAGNCLSTSAITVRTAALRACGGFRENAAFVTAEDYDLWLRLARADVRFEFIDDVLGKYVLHADNQMRAIRRNTDAVMAVVEDHFATLDPAPRDSWRLARRMERRRAGVLYGGARGLQDSHQRAAAFALYCESWKRWPWSWKLYAGMLTNALGVSLH